jgi:hypothetical protein
MSAVPSSLSSQRTVSRIALWIGIGLLIAAVVVFVVKRSHDSGSSSASNSSSAAPATKSKASALNPNPLQGQRQADIQTNKKWSQLDPKAKVAVRSFIFDGAGLDNLARAWRYTDPSIRQGFTRNQWIHANALPFQVFPELNRKVPASYTLTEWAPRDFLAQVGLASTHKTGRVGYTFLIGGHKYGSGANAHWMINYWMPLYTPPVRADPSQTWGG